MRWRTLALVIALIGAPTMVGAQEHRDHAAAAQKAETAAAPAGSDGMMSCPMMAGHASRMGGMRAMPSRGQDGGMGPRMGSPAMGMIEMMPMPGPDADPKTHARWMRMRGEMMKAMGDILVRHGRELESGT